MHSETAVAGSRRQPQDTSAGAGAHPFVSWEASWVEVERVQPRGRLQGRDGGRGFCEHGQSAFVASLDPPWQLCCMVRAAGPGAASKCLRGGGGSTEAVAQRQRHAAVHVHAVMPCRELYEMKLCHQGHGIAPGY